MRFSLILCTLGRCDEIGAFIESLLAQHDAMPGGVLDCELIVVDQNTDDRVEMVLKRYADRLMIRHLRMEGTGLSRARNAGLAIATGELVGFPDDDCEYLPGLLDHVDRLFSRDATVDVITGHPTAARLARMAVDPLANRVTLNAVTVLDRCQEFTIFLRREALGDVRFNEFLGVGAQTPWGAEEGPDFLIRLVKAGNRLVYFPDLLVYHPDKIREVSSATVARAASYARGRGCLFRLHRFPLRVIAKSLIRPLGGSIIYTLRLQPARAAYYRAIFLGICRGLLISPSALGRVRAGKVIDDPVAEGTELLPLRLPPLSPRPLVSVLMSNFNYARYLPIALNSLLNQTYTHWEAVIVDDGSTDDSVRVIEDLAARDSRVKLVRKANGGQNSAVNECFRHLVGEVICLLDPDDVFAPTKIASVVAAFEANPDAGVCNHFARVVDGGGEQIIASLNHRLDEGWLANSAGQRGACVNVPTTSCMSFRREVLAELMPVPEGGKRTDADGYLGMAAQYLTPFLVIHERLSDYRVHGANMGGVTEPTVDRLRYELLLIGNRTQALREFLSKRFGAAVANTVRQENNPQYIQAALKLRAIGGSTPGEKRVNAGALIRQHPNSKWRAVWRILFWFPAPARRRVLPLMHRSYRLKAFVQSFLLRSERPMEPAVGAA